MAEAAEAVVAAAEPREEGGDLVRKLGEIVVASQLLVRSVESAVSIPSVRSKTLVSHKNTRS